MPRESLCNYRDHKLPWKKLILEVCIFKNHKSLTFINYPEMSSKHHQSSVYLQEKVRDFKFYIWRWDEIIYVNISNECNEESKYYWSVMKKKYPDVFF